MTSPDPTLSRGETPGDPETPGGAHGLGMRLSPPLDISQTVSKHETNIV